MRLRRYRICLLSLLIIAVVGGIFYYWNLGQNKREAIDGTFVHMLQNDNLRAFFGEEKAFKIVGSQVMYGEQ